MNFSGLKYCYVLIFAFIVACNEPPRPPKEGTRYIPVTTMTVQEHRLTHSARLTGSILPWKIEELRFQVPGRLAKLNVLHPGAFVRGELKDENGKLIYPGDIIAELDKEPYELAVKEANIQLSAAKTQLEAAKRSLAVSEETIKAAQARIEALQTEIKEIFPLNLKIAAEQKKLAEQEFELTEKAYQKQDVTNSRILQARTQMFVAQAEEKKLQLTESLKNKELQTYQGDLAKALVEKDLRDAEIKIAEAQVLQAESVLKRAKRELEKCQLRASFDGVISTINVNPGILVTPEIPIATLAMMDPVRIDVSISLKKLRDFNIGGEVAIYPTMGYINPYAKPEKGILYYLNTTADPSTRTFLAVFAARNYRKSLDKDFLPQESNNYPHFNNFSGLVYKDAEGGGNLFVDTRCLLVDDKGTYVWKIDGVSLISTVQKVYVKTGNGLANVITWLFRELKDSNNLQENDVLLVGTLEDFKNLKDGDKIVRQRDDWLFRPGELVEVEYGRELPMGLYLPSDAILQSQGEEVESYYVFVVENKRQDDGKMVADAVRRNIIKTKTEDIWKIEKGLQPNDQIVIGGCYRVNNKYNALQSDIPIRIHKEENFTELIKGYKPKDPIR